MKLSAGISLLALTATIAFAGRNAPPTLRIDRKGDIPATPWVFVMPGSGVVDAATRPPDGPGDLCYAFFCSLENEGFMVTVAVFDDAVSTDNCNAGSTSCPAWDDDAVEVFIDGEYARLPDSRSDGGIHLKHGGEFSLVANGAAMSDFSGYHNGFKMAADAGPKASGHPPTPFGRERCVATVPCSVTTFLRYLNAPRALRRTGQSRQTTCSTSHGPRWAARTARSG